MEITKEQFEKYLKVQVEGKYNMFDSNAQKATGLSEEVYNYIIWHYDELVTKYEELYNRYWEGK